MGLLSVCPVCNVCLLWPNGWMDQDATWYGARPLPRPHCVRWGSSFPPHRKGHSSPPLFGPRLLWQNDRPMLWDCCPVCNVCLLWPNGWIDQDATWNGARLCPGHIVLDGDPASPPQKGAQQSPTFRPTSIVAKWSPISATAERLLSLASCSNSARESSERL